MGVKAFGSGHFGQWTEDRFGLPSYTYTCDHAHDPAAVTPTNPVWRDPREHLHQVGNDRITAIASNFGHLLVRQDEGSPKLLNDFDPGTRQFGGGFGWLVDGSRTLTTFCRAGGPGLERVFGMGYFQKRVSRDSLEVDQLVFAPHGDDPVLVSQVTITNKRSAPADLRWIEYWGARAYQLSYRAVILAILRKDINQAARIRRNDSMRLTRQYRPAADGRGLAVTTSPAGRGLRSRLELAAVRRLLSAAWKTPLTATIRGASGAIRIEDPCPPDVFLLSLDGPADGMETDADAFFGAGGAEDPAGLRRPRADRPAVSPANGALLLERAVRLEAGQSRTLTFLYGYVPEGFSLERLVEKYSRGIESLFPRSCDAWKEGAITFDVPAEPWVRREMAWHNYYLRSALSRDSFFKGHVLSQGHIYQYVLGFQGAARDHLQHALPFIFSQPWIVKEVLRANLMEVLPDGEVPYAMVGNGMIMPSPFHPSDQDLWLLWLASEYVLATRDTEFLGETVDAYPARGRRSATERVEELLMRSFRHLRDVVGVGGHGLIRISNGDWNDGVVIGHVPRENRPEVRRIGESVLNAAMASCVLRRFSTMLSIAGQLDRAREASDMAEAQARAVRAQWNGRWLKRAWMTEDLGWIGDRSVWLEPQPWALIAQCLEPSQARTLVGNIDTLLRAPSPIGAMLCDAGIRNMEMAPGILNNGGVWPSINGTLVWALAGVDPAMAWDEWKKNSLARHAETYPDTWYGIWSGPDSYNSILSRYPGQTQFDESILTGVPGPGGAAFGLTGVNWTDFPVMNLHPHAWQLYSAARLLGVEFTAEGLEASPRIPVMEYAFESPLLGIRRSRRGFSGWYAPLRRGRWTVVLRLDDSDLRGLSTVTVNGLTSPLSRDDAGRISMTGEGSRETPLAWSIE